MADQIWTCSLGFVFHVITADLLFLDASLAFVLRFDF
jgi:hypothetical protein